MERSRLFSLLAVLSHLLVGCEFEPIRSVSDSRLAAAPILSYGTTSEYFLTSEYRSLFPSSANENTRFNVSPALPAGLQIHPNTGVIFGTASTATPLTAYTITASNDQASASITISIRTDNGFRVNSLGDAGDAAADGACQTALGECTLRAAVEEGGVAIVLLPLGTITVGTVLNVTSGPVAFIGMGTSESVVSGGGTSTIFSLATGASVEFDSLQLRNGKDFAAGGAAISSADPLTVRNVLFESNDSIFGAAAIQSYGPTTVERSIFRSNTAPYAAAAAFNDNATIRDSVFENNQAGFAGGGAVRLSATAGPRTFLIERSLFSGNSSTSTGGAIQLMTGGVNTLSAIIRNSTFDANLTDTGGAILAQSLTILNSINNTFSGNRSVSSADGGAIENQGTLNLTNTLFFGNLNSANAIDACTNSGTINSLGINLSDTAAADCNLVGAGDLPNTNALLGALADNGGRSKTRGLLSGSPAINAGTNAGCPVDDQRAFVRPVSGTCDIGAFEAQ